VGMTNNLKIVIGEKMENIIRRFAGVFVLGSLALGYFVSPYWFLFTAFVGLNLLQSSFTNWCPLEMMLKKVKKN
jgi:hypothetical protein